jgi:ferredoxin
MKRKIIHIDERLCDGCGLCIPNCPEGAIRLDDGKARLAGELLCDGLGACLGHCPQGAITVEGREAEAYDERRVMEQVAPQGGAAIQAHLDHLKEHGQKEYLRQALAYLDERAIGIGGEAQEPEPAACGCAAEPRAAQAAAAAAASPRVSGGCPGARAMAFEAAEADRAAPAASELTHWPVQLHLVSPLAPHFRGADVVLSADCAAYALGDFHRRFLKGRGLAIACPKLDDGQQIYAEKLQALIEQAEINTLTVVIMEVPCCGGLLRLAQAAMARASRNVPLKAVVVGVRGQILREEWV